MTSVPAMKINSFGMVFYIIGNKSVYSEFEKLMRENRRQEAANLLQENKGTI